MNVYDQITEQRKQISEMVKTDPVVRTVFEIKRHNDLTDYETMVLLAYNAIKLYNKTVDNFKRYMELDTRTVEVHIKEMK